MSFSFPVIETDRLTLRAIRQSDAEAVFDILSNPQVMEHYDSHPFSQLSQAEQWVQQSIFSYSFIGKKGFRWAIALKQKPEPYIGSCGVHTLSKNYQSLHIGYELHPQYWGKGIAAEAISAIIEFCFTHHFPIQITRIAATTDLNNQRSIALLNKLGFQEKGILREYGYWKDKYNDVRMFSLLRADWLNNKGSNISSLKSKQDN